MKTLLQKLSGLMLFIFISSGLLAQLPNIDLLTIMPANPTTDNVVRVAALTMFPSGGCQMTNSSVNVVGSKIDVYATHALGPMAYICSSSDTTNIGLLQSGYYTLRYHLSCTPYPPTTDIDSICFNVTTSTGFNDIENNEQQLEIFPNPFENSFILNMKSPATINEVSVYDLYGKKHLTLFLYGDLCHVNVSELPDGIYIIEALNGNYTYRQKIIKH